MRKKLKKSTIRPPEGVDPGRFLEQLVEAFERAIGHQVQVKSPDRLPDQITGELREIDVSIRSSSPHLLVIIECRNRNHVEDVCWVEQVVTKRNDVGATLAVLVTNKPVTAPAQSKAKHYGVITRTVNQATSEADIREWFGSDFRFILREVNSSLCDWGIHLNQDDQRPFEALTDDRTAPICLIDGQVIIRHDAHVFQLGGNGELLTVNDVWSQENQLAANSFEFGHDSRPFFLRLNADLDPNKSYTLRIGDYKLKVKYFTFHGEAWVTERLTTPCQGYAYLEDDATRRAKMVTHQVAIPGQGTHELTLIHVEGKKIQLQHRPIDL